uniref:UDP-xylose and UDP-N-acetylglucosamine transporter isoform X1 n=1 Tax=Ciona intestinalis TaxID=7719 RepID=UPI000180B4ED|nr:UDP-xylose and UDP-N-acetylglucosamine transporter isoform X1 [Ciona intestinalis]XP_009861274.1 UDP-xylose and UDP-N-acetylglucosamine transporter isoform X1 [Ciona intestinalis]XP_026694116.1 UDP-xylose and UDP-N-acetylglucosamine transporter isoform X2 [Ciona intestinalis]|eukprot:XP_002126859.1 UDP-xylose and UDP-N-acetylglucosamine transporter isoform X1 [Ciona intestinalis]
MAELWTMVAMVLVMVGCCSNVIFLEHLIRASSSSGNMIVFFQFLFIFLEGLVFHNKFGKTKRIIPMKNYLMMVAMHFTVNITNIMALDCDIPMPLHMIFKSGSLVANLLLGCIVMKQRYPPSKFVSVLFVSVGIFICTLATGMHQAQTSSMGTSPFTIILGVTLLTYALLMSARLGIYQERLFRQYGKQSREAMFYNHLIPLPLFIFVAPTIVTNIEILNASPPSPTTHLPILWQHMVMNIVTQYICIRCIFYLTTVTTSLTVTLLITLRKFVSIFISVVYFGNHFTSSHVIGAIFVFIGTILYSDISSWKRTGKSPNPVSTNGVHKLKSN